MKKIVIIVVILCSVLMIFGGVTTSAAIPPSYFLPSGVNYLNPKNIYYIPIDGENEGTLHSREQIVVKEATEYYIYCVYRGNFALTSSCIEVWDYDEDDFVEIESEVYGELLYFEVPDGVDRVSVSFGVINVNRNPNIKISNVKNNYVMAEAGTFDDEELESHDFQGYDTSDYSLLGESILINTVASNPISYNTIFNSLYVFDYVDGMLTNSKEVVSNTYGTSDYKVGDWEIQFTVKNSRNVSKGITIHIHVDDDVKPVISGPDEYEMKNIDLKTLDDIKEELTASDNNDGDLTGAIEVDTEHDEFTNRTEQLGSFPVTYMVTDEAGNVGTHVVTVNIVQGDFQAPVFSGTFERRVPISSPLTRAQILADITADDDYSGDITNQIEVIYDDYQYNTGCPGYYRVTLSVTDYAGNNSTKDITIIVYDDTEPTYAFASTFVYLPLKTNMENADDIVAFLQRTGYLTDDDYIIKTDTYSQNKNVLGSYVITLEQNNTTTSVVVNVAEQFEYLNAIELPKTVEYNIDLTDRPVVLNVIYNVCCRIKSFFEDFFSSIF